jgi:hypothetical protein
MYGSPAIAFGLGDDKVDLVGGLGNEGVGDRAHERGQYWTVSWTHFNYVHGRQHFVGGRRAGIDRIKDDLVAAARFNAGLRNQQDEFLEVDFGNRWCVGDLGILRPQFVPSLLCADGGVMGIWET